MPTYFPKRFVRGALLSLLLFFLAGFSKAGIDTEQGHYILEVESVEKFLRVGDNSIKITFFHRKSRSPVRKKLALEVIPWMATSEHGTTELPTVKDLGNGVYLVERLNFSEAGAWEVYIRIDKGERKEDSAVFDVNVYRKMKVE